MLRPVAALLAAGAMGCVGNVTPDALPAVVLVGPAQAEVGERVVLAVTHASGGGSVVRYIFDFGDSSPSPALATSSPGATHVYTAAGKFTPSVRLVDARGRELPGDRLDSPIDVLAVRPDAGPDAGPDARADRVDAPVDPPADIPDAPRDPSFDRPVDPAVDQPVDPVVDPRVDPVVDPVVDPRVDPVVDPPSPPSYTRTVSTGSCTDIRPTGTPVGPLDDDEGAAIMLPFVFRFFGAIQGSVGIASNGYLQLPGTAGKLLADPTNTAIPTAAEPNAVVAAFWDDLVPPSGKGSSFVHTLPRAGAAGGREIVIQWTSWSLFGAVPAASLTFQAILMESGVIELRYCTLTSTSDPGRATGGSATVGIEAPDGATGVQHSYKMPMAVSTTQVIRFAPN